jgi:hypothetical protein
LIIFDIAFKGNKGKIKGNNLQGGNAIYEEEVTDAESSISDLDNLNVEEILLKYKIQEPSIIKEIEESFKDLTTNKTLDIS